MTHPPRGFQLGMYRLIGRLPVLCDDPIEWSKWFAEDKNRIVAQTDVGPLFVSTVFLGVDHNFFDDGPSRLFETMIFVEGKPLSCGRYETWDEAEKGHVAAIAEAEKMLNDVDVSLRATAKETDGESGKGGR